MISGDQEEKHRKALLTSSPRNSFVNTRGSNYHPSDKKEHRAMAHRNDNRPDAIDIPKPMNFTGGLEFFTLTYSVIKNEQIDGHWVKRDVDLIHRITGYAPKGCITAVMGPSGAGKSTFLDGLAGRITRGSLKGRVYLDGMEMTPRLIKRATTYIMQDDRLFPMLTVYETLMFAADFRLGQISRADKIQRVEKLMEQLGLLSSRNIYIGNEGTRGMSRGERRRVSIGIGIIHRPSLLFLDDPTSGLDLTSAHCVMEKVHNIARSGSTVILTIHQPSSRIRLLLDHLVILARGQLMFQGSPKDATLHLGRMGRKVPKGVDSMEYIIEVIREYNQLQFGIEFLADFAQTGMKPLPPSDKEMSISTAACIPPSHHRDHRHRGHDRSHDHRSGQRLHLQGNMHSADDDFDHSLRSPDNNWSRSWTPSYSKVKQALRFTFQM